MTSTYPTYGTVQARDHPVAAGEPAEADSAPARGGGPPVSHGAGHGLAGPPFCKPTYSPKFGKIQNCTYRTYF